MGNTSLYRVLGLTDFVSIQEVKRAYRELAKQYHPDRNPGNKAAEEKFKIITNAYNVLGDIALKADYDTRLRGVFHFEPIETKEEQLAKRRKKREEALLRKKEYEERKIKKNWHEIQNGTPPKIRNTYSYSLIATGVVLIFHYWYHNTSTTYSPWYLLGAIVLIIWGNIRIQSYYYIKYLYLQIQKKINFSPANRVFRNFILGFVLSFALGVFGAKSLMKFHLKYYFGITKGTVYYSGYGRYKYSFVYWVDRKQYVRDFNSTEFFAFHSGDTVSIRYALLNPALSEIILPNSHTSDN